MSTLEPPHYPIIYVRGYAGTDAEIDETVADPYMGFNIGATKFRQVWTGQVRRHYFESPLYRLTKDFGYSDVYSNGQFMPDDWSVPAKCVVIYRYYDEQFFDDLSGNDPASLDEITGLSRDIERFASGLGALILRLRDRVCGNDADARKAFRVYIIAHSMGGLVTRCFLQNPDVATKEAKILVDKVFTYATPHNGIDVRVLGNVPSFFSTNSVNNFSRPRMAQYLGLTGSTPSVDDLNGTFDPDRFFCAVGTNWRDYSAAGGWSKRLVGPMSDGLVQIANAAVSGDWNGRKIQSPRAYVHRSHSGHFGIVNSEEAYQNLVRFLFGDVRVDGILDLDEITLPPDVKREKENGKEIRASYHFEVILRVRGYDWDLHRRTADEESAVFRSYDEIFPKDGSRLRPPHLFSTFLSAGARVKARRQSLGFSIDLGVLVPEYVVNGFLWRESHYRGSYLYRDTITIEATPTTGSIGQDTYKIRYGYGSRTPNRVTATAEVTESSGDFRFEIPVQSKTTPGLKGRLALTARNWS